MSERKVFWGIAVDSVGNAYVSARSTNNVFRISPSGHIREIINASGDGEGNRLKDPSGIAVDSSGNVFVPAVQSHNAFRVTSRRKRTEIIDADGDRSGNKLDDLSRAYLELL